MRRFILMLIGWLAGLPVFVIAAMTLAMFTASASCPPGKACEMQRAPEWAGWLAAAIALVPGLWSTYSWLTYREPESTAG